jgi:hypothetical protein
MSPRPRRSHRVRSDRAVAGERVPFRGLKCRRFPESDFKTSRLYTRCCSPDRCGVHAGFGHGEALVDDRQATYEPCADPIEPWWTKPGSRAAASSGFRGYFDRCHLLESGESLSALWLARYPDSGNERKRVLGVPRCLTGPIVRQAL